MSGKPKAGISYAGWNTDIFENDTKIDELIDAQGWIGFSIYFDLCQRAYASDGYFYRWSYANAATTARRMGGGIRAETIKAVVATCLQIGLFERSLFDRVGVLTSKGIQRRYVEAIQKRSYKRVDQNIWLLNVEESKGLDVCTLNGDSLPEDGDSLPEDAPKSKSNKSKLYQSKSKETTPYAGGDDDVCPDRELEDTYEEWLDMLRDKGAEPQAGDTLDAVLEYARSAAIPATVASVLRLYTSRGQMNIGFLSAKRR